MITLADSLLVEIIRDPVGITVILLIVITGVCVRNLLKKTDPAEEELAAAQIAAGQQTTTERPPQKFGNATSYKPENEIPIMKLDPNMKPRTPVFVPFLAGCAGCAGAAGISLILVLLAAGAYGYVVLGFMELLSTGKHTMLDNIGLGR